MCREGEGAFSYDAATDSFDFDLEEDDEVHLWHQMYCTDSIAYGSLCTLQRTVHNCDFSGVVQEQRAARNLSASLCRAGTCWIFPL